MRARRHAGRQDHLRGKTACTGTGVAERDELPELPRRGIEDAQQQEGIPGLAPAVVPHGRGQGGELRAIKTQLRPLGRSVQRKTHRRGDIFAGLPGPERFARMLAVHGRDRLATELVHRSGRQRTAPQELEITRQRPDIVTQTGCRHPVPRVVLQDIGLVHAGEAEGVDAVGAGLLDVVHLIQLVRPFRIRAPGGIVAPEEALALLAQDAVQVGVGVECVIALACALRLIPGQGHHGFLPVAKGEDAVPHLGGDIGGLLRQFARDPCQIRRNE